MPLIQVLSSTGDGGPAGQGAAGGAGPRSWEEAPERHRAAGASSDDDEAAMTPVSTSRVRGGLGGKVAGPLPVAVAVAVAAAAAAAAEAEAEAALVPALVPAPAAGSSGPTGTDLEGALALAEQASARGDAADNGEPRPPPSSSSWKLWAGSRAAWPVGAGRRWAHPPAAASLPPPSASRPPPRPPKRREQEGGIRPSGPGWTGALTSAARRAPSPRRGTA